MWDKLQNQYLFTIANLDSAEELIDLVTQHGLTMALKKYTFILKALNSRNYTRLDNVFIIDTFSDRIIHYTTKPKLCLPWTNHIPILIILDIKYHTEVPSLCYNFHKVN